MWILRGKVLVFWENQLKNRSFLDSLRVNSVDSLTTDNVVILLLTHISQMKLQDVQIYQL